jgi:long-chain fatty acid transport protein
LKKHLGLVLCLALFLGIAPLAHGSGFLIYEHGAAAMGMAGAFVSIGSDASTVFHNPAGMSMLSGTNISLGGTIIKPKGSLTLPKFPNPAFAKVDQLDQTFLAPNFYLTHKFGKKFAAGIGVFAPYGLGTKWPENYPLRYLGTSNEMQTVFINPSISYLVSDNFSIGGGVSYVTSKLSLNLVRLVTDFAPYGWVGDVPASLDGATGDALSFNLGVLYKTGTYSLGATWRSAFDIKYKGDIALDTSGIPSPFRPLAPTSGTVETTFKFPDIFTFGGSFKPVEDLTVAVDAQYYTWSRYDKYVIDITYPSGPAEPETVLENWKNTWIFRCGLQYDLNESLALRGGFIYDWTPQPVASIDPNLPDANRYALTLGIGYKIGRILIDVGYQYEKFSDRTSPNRDIYPFGWGEGTFKTTGHLFGVSLGYGF